MGAQINCTFEVFLVSTLRSGVFLLWALYACNTKKLVEKVIPLQKVVCNSITPDFLFDDLTLLECMDLIPAIGQISIQWFQQ
jgi:hypothetical protein